MTRTRWLGSFGSPQARDRSRRKGRRARRTPVYYYTFNETTVTMRHPQRARSGPGRGSSSGSSRPLGGTGSGGARCLEPHGAPPRRAVARVRRRVARAALAAAEGRRVAARAPHRVAERDARDAAKPLGAVCATRGRARCGAPWRTRPVLAVSAPRPVATHRQARRRTLPGHSSAGPRPGPRRPWPASSWRSRPRPAWSACACNERARTRRRPGAGRGGGSVQD